MNRDVLAVEIVVVVLMADIVTLLRVACVVAFSLFLSLRAQRNFLCVR